MNSRFVKINYKIHDFITGYRKVTGYAVRSNCSIRFCVRKKNDYGWVADHYETGAGLGVCRPTRTRAADAAEHRLLDAIYDGTYDKALQRAYDQLTAKKAKK